MHLRSFLFTNFLTLGLALLARGADLPNVVIIYGDDVGYGDVGAYGSKLIPTPHIDQLAADGIRFTDGHTSSATCTPSRFSLLTGIHGFRHGVRILAPNAPMVIARDKLSLPQLFKKAGYQTAIIGKWHLGIGDGKHPVDWNGAVKPGPLEVGFDYSFLLPSTNDRVPCVYVENHRVVNLDPADPLYVGTAPRGHNSTVYPDGRKVPAAMTYYKNSHGHNHSVINGIGRIGTQFGGKSALWDDETMSDEFVKKTKKYLTNRTKDQPFFLFFSSQCIHVPRAPNKRFQGKTTLGYRGDAMVEFDWCVGEIMKALEAERLTENTIVIFSSDNGPVYDDGYKDGTVVKKSLAEVDQGHDGSGPYSGGKYEIQEGGTRVPFIVTWPAKITPGQVSKALVSQIDLFASFADLLEIPLGIEDAIDSRNTLKAFLGEDQKGLPFMIEEARELALRRGPWKLVQSTSPSNRKKQTPKNAESREPKLFNLDTDIAEKKNIASENPEITLEMDQLLTKLKKTEAGIRALIK